MDFMTNVRIESQGRVSYVGAKKYEYFNVVANSPRFGDNEIMFQGTFRECISYLERNNINYFEECYRRNRGKDIQISFRMYEIKGREGDILALKDREGFKHSMNVLYLKPIAPNTFKLSGHSIHGDKLPTVKLMDARAW